MKVYSRRFQHVSNFLVIGTGAGYAYVKYLIPPLDPFSNTGSPLVPWFQNLHIYLAPFLVFACGLIWQRHIAPMMLKPNPKKRSWLKVITGFGLILVFVPMVLTGYMIQTTVDDFWRKIWIAVHLITSLAWSFSYLSHVIKKPAK